MARKGTFVTEPRSEQYAFKQLLLRTGYGHLPEYLAEAARAQVEKQRAHWEGGFGVMHRVWQAVDSKVLKPAIRDGRIAKLDVAKYKAFVSQYVSKVQMKATETTDMVKAKFQRQGCLPEVMDEITSVIGEVLTA